MPEKTQKVTVCGLMAAVDSRNGFRSEELGKISVTPEKYAELEGLLAEAGKSLTNNLQTIPKAKGRRDELPMHVEIRLVAIGADGFYHETSLRYVLHGSQKWNGFHTTVQAMAAGMGFVRDNVKPKA